MCFWYHIKSPCVKNLFQHKKTLNNYRLLSASASQEQTLKPFTKAFIVGFTSTLTVISLASYILHDQILTYIMVQIFNRRQQYLKECFPHRIILVRHGQSQANVNEEELGKTPDHLIPLTEKGKQQALEAGRKLKEIIKDEAIYMYYSPYLRAAQTMDYLVKGGKFDETDQVKVTIEDVRLIEQKFGNLQTKTLMEEQKKSRMLYSRYFFQFKEGESALNVNLRAAAFVDRLFDHFRTGYYSTRPGEKWNVVIVSHGLFMRVFLKAFLRKSISEFETWYNFKNCQFCILEKNEKEWFSISKDTPLAVAPVEKNCKISNISES